MTKPSHYYIVLLKNQYLKIENKKPVKKGNYLQGVKLFEVKATLGIKAVSDWVENDYDSAEITEVKDWV